MINQSEDEVVNEDEDTPLDAATYFVPPEVARINNPEVACSYTPEVDSSSNPPEVPPIKNPPVPSYVPQVDMTSNAPDDSEDLIMASHGLLQLMTIVGTKAGDDRKCALCEEDDTLQDVYVAKSASLMRKHTSSSIHTGQEHWKRKCAREGTKWRCPYCTKLFSRFYL